MAKNKKPKFLEKETPDLLALLKETLAGEEADTKKALKITEELISRLRFGKGTVELSAYQRKNFLNGPGKLCKGLSLTRAENGLDATGDILFVCESLDDLGLPPEPPPIPTEIHVGKRIGIDYAQEAIDFPWRFYVTE